MPCLSARFAVCLLLGMLHLAATPPVRGPRKESWSRSGRTVRGIRLGPGVVVPPGTDLRNADLRNLDLSDALLDGVDLRGAQLQGSDLTAARLGAARTGGAHWAGATLFRATSSDLFHFNAPGARLLPFFETQASDPVGKVGELVLMDEDEPEGELRVVMDPNGVLIWRIAQSRHVTMVAPSGMEFIHRSPGLKPLDASKDDLYPAHFCLDSHRQLWSPIGALGGFAQDLPNHLKPSGGGGEGTWYDCNALVREAPVKGIIADSKRGVWTFGDGWMARHIVGMPPAARKILSHTTALPGMRPRAMVALEDGQVAFLDEGKDWVGTFTSKTKKVDRFPLWPGSQACSMTVINGLSAVVSCPGLMRVEMVDLGGTLDPDPMELRDDEGTLLEPGQVTLGPDGNVWVTAKGRAGLVRIGGADVPDWFPLPEGMIPQAFVGAHNGCLLFSVAGNRSVGSIRVLPPETPAGLCGSSSSSSSWAHAPALARPTLQSSRLVHRERRRAEAALRRELPGEAEPTPESVEEAMEEKDGKEEKRAPAPRPKPAPARSRLSAPQRLVNMGVRLDRRGVKKVLDFHGFGKMEDKSQFAECFSTQAGLEGLLAGALEDHELGRVRTRFDSRGCELTPCRRPGAGWYSNWGEWVPTDRFLLVTRCVWHEGRWVHRVVNAYPISENW